MCWSGGKGGEMVRDWRPWAIIFASLHNKKDEKSLYFGTKKVLSCGEGREFE